MTSNLGVNFVYFFANSFITQLSPCRIRLVLSYIFA